MKKLLLLPLLFLIMAGCSQKPDNMIQFTGTLMNPDDSQLMFLYSGVRDTILVNDDGSFIFEKEGEKPLSGTLMYGRKRASIWVAPGKTLDMSVDVNDWDRSIGFSGDLSLVNEYLLKKGIHQMSWGINYLANFQKTPEKFRSSRDSLELIFSNLLDEYKEKGMDKNFLEVEKISLTYTRYGDLNNFPRLHQHYAKVEEVNLPDDWYDFKETMDLNDPLLMDVDQAMYFLTSWINAEAPEKAGLGPDAWGTPELLTAKFNFIDETFTLPAMKEKFKFDILSQHLDSGPPAGVEEIIEDYLSTSQNEENKTVITEKRAAWEAIAAGQPAPEWTLPDIDGNSMSLADFKGKYVYIDFWATWCGPCLAEIPEYRQLVKEYEGKNVVFISISVDRDKPAWEKMVNEEKFEWVQLHDGLNMNDNYLVRYIPTFVLIDREGKIIDPRAPRPSEQKLRNLLDSQEGL